MMLNHHEYHAYLKRTIKLPDRTAATESDDTPVAMVTRTTEVESGPCCPQRGLRGEETKCPVCGGAMREDTPREYDFDHSGRLRDI